MGWQQDTLPACPLIRMSEHTAEFARPRHLLCFELKAFILTVFRLKIEGYDSNPEALPVAR